jgi:DedD protein
MARPISEEELRLKKRARRRLVGAIVLVAAVAVVLPMVLDSEPRPVDHNVDIHIPSPDSGEFKPQSAAPTPQPPIKGLPEGRKSETPAAAGLASERAPASVSSRRADAAGTPASGPAAKSDAPPSAPSASEDKEAPKAEAGEGVKTAKEAAATTGGAYVVQVAALADVSKAKQLQKRVSGAGLKTYTEVVKTKNGEVTRVRAGPYATREAAEKARTQLQKAGLDGQVVPR